MLFSVTIHTHIHTHTHTHSVVLVRRARPAGPSSGNFVVLKVSIEICSRHRNIVLPLGRVTKSNEAADAVPV